MTHAPHITQSGSDKVIQAQQTAPAFSDGHK
jgi:hypothetical protein